MTHYIAQARRRQLLQIAPALSEIKVDLVRSTQLVGAIQHKLHYDLGVNQRLTYPLCFQRLVCLMCLEMLPTVRWTHTSNVDLMERRDGKTVKPFSEMPGPKGLPLIGTLWEYVKKDGLRFNKMFEVRLPQSLLLGLLRNIFRKFPIFFITTKDKLQCKSNL